VDAEDSNMPVISRGARIVQMEPIIFASNAARFERGSGAQCIVCRKDFALSHYRHNKYRADVIARHGVTVGLPLFSAVGKQLPEPTKSRFENAPKAVRLATDTKKLAHLTLTFDKVRLSEKQNLVLETIIAHEELTNTEIAHLMNWPINRVVGRVFELRHLGINGQPFVVDAGKRPCSITGEIVHAWKFNPAIPKEGAVEEL
jgi:hypothetical protein